MWHYLLSLLTSLSADPAAIDAEAPRAAAAVAYAYAAMAPEKPAAHYQSTDKPAPASTKAESSK
jgi:hypothetical protein